MRGNPVYRELVWYSPAFPDKPPHPARVLEPVDEHKGLVRIELIGGARDGESIVCEYDETGTFGCSWFRPGDPERFVASGRPVIG
jgi:hypothetical protein